MVYLMETNANVYSWLVEFYKKNPIPKVRGLVCLARALVLARGKSKPPNTHCMMRAKAVHA